MNFALARDPWPACKVFAKAEARFRHRYAHRDSKGIRFLACVTSPFTWGRSCHGQVQPKTQAVYLRAFALGYRTLHLLLLLLLSFLFSSPLFSPPPGSNSSFVKRISSSRPRSCTTTPKGGKEEGEGREKKKKEKEKSKSRGRCHRETVVPPFCQRGDGYRGRGEGRERESSLYDRKDAAGR